MSGQRLPDDGVGYGSNPGAGGVDENTRSLHLAAASGVEHQLPLTPPLRARAAGARPDNRTVLGSIQCVESNEPGIINPAIGVLETVTERPFERLTDHVVR